MPHIEIKCYPGRTEEIKRDCAKKVASDVAQMFGCDISAVSVSIKEIDKSEWKKVYDGQIMSDKRSLYVEPGYTCD